MTTTRAGSGRRRAAVAAAPSERCATGVTRAGTWCSNEHSSWSDRETRHFDELACDSLTATMGAHMSLTDAFDSAQERVVTVQAQALREGSLSAAAIDFDAKPLGGDQPVGLTAMLRVGSVLAD